MCRFGWSLLEGLGAALIMPAIVSLVASNFPSERRAGAYGLVAAAGAAAVAVGPLLGGAVTTFASWRYVFAGEVVLVVMILAVLRRIEDAPASSAVRLDIVGSALSVLGLGMVVFGVLRSSEWGWVRSKPNGPQVFGLSPVVWLLMGGLVVLYGFMRWQIRVAAKGGEPLVRPGMLRNRQLAGGLTMFFAQFLIQAGVFFSVPLFLSVVLELSAMETGLRILPLSAALVLAAAGIPKFVPDANPRRVVRVGLASMIVGIVMLVAGVDPAADASVVMVPMLFMGFGLGALSSQLGAITVSSVADSESAEVGGLQNTATNLGASLGTALIGSILIATLTGSVLAGIEDNPAVPASVAERASTELADGVPFLSTPQLQDALTSAGVTGQTADAVVEINADARLDALRVAFAVTALLAITALFATGLLPRRAIGRTRAASEP